MNNLDLPSFPTRRSSDLAIGAARPVGFRIDTFGTNHVPETVIERAVGEVFDLRPGAIIADLDLLRPIYSQDRKSTRLNSSHVENSYAVFCLQKKNGHRSR